MAKIKYYYDTKTLSYKRIQLTTFKKVKRISLFLLSSVSIGLIMLLVFYQFFDSPKEKRLNREITNLADQYEIVDAKLNQVELVLDDMQNRDDNIYRVIFEADPIPNSIRKAGYGGINRYEKLKQLNNSELVINTTKKLDQISKQLYIQSKSFDEIIESASS